MGESDGRGRAERPVRLTGSGGHRHADISVYQDLAPGRHDGGLGSIDVVAGGEGAAACRQAGLVRELLDQQRGRLVELGDRDCGAVGAVGGSHGVFGNGLDALCWGRVGR